MTEKKLDWGKPFEAFLESGAVLDARLLSSDYRHGDITYRVVQVEHGNRSGVYTYHENGAPRYKGDAPPLRNKRVKHEAWQNIYRDRIGNYSGARFYKSEELAREQGVDDPTYITTVKIEWEE